MANNIGDFYAHVPVFADFSQLTDASLYRPLPEDWVIGMSDVVASATAIRAGQYKIVNLAGAASIAGMSRAGAAGLSLRFWRRRRQFCPATAGRRESAGRVGRHRRLGAGRSIPHSPGGFDPRGDGPRRRLGCTRGTLRSFTQCQLRHVYRRRLGLGRTRNESWRQSCQTRNNRYAAKPDWFVVPLA